MDIVIDANVLFAALIKKGATSELLFVDDIHLYAPEFLLIEFYKYKKEILRKTHRQEDELKKFIDIIERRINFVTRNETSPFLEEAEKLSPDIKDIPYLAVALRLKCPLWSNDSRLKKQNKIRIYSTKEMLEVYENR